MIADLILHGPSGPVRLQRAARLELVAEVGPLGLAAVYLSPEARQHAEAFIAAHNSTCAVRLARVYIPSGILWEVHVEGAPAERGEVSVSEPTAGAWTAGGPVGRA